MRAELEKQAKALKLTFSKETTDEALGLMIQLAEANSVNAELADKVAKLETASEAGGNLTVIKHDKKLYTTHAKQFYYNPVQQNSTRRGAGGLVTRGRVSLKGRRVVIMAEVELPENADALEWLISSKSSLLKEVKQKEKGGK
jgi:hypothetical protein